MTHPTHKTRISDASTFDEICVHCGATDTRGSDLLNLPCPNAPPPPAAPAPRPVVQYEYKTDVVHWREPGSNSLDKDLVRLGDEGWEMCGCVPSSSCQGMVRAFFKRPKGGA